MTATYYRHALPEGEILGDYEVVSVLGAGGFGVTYLVKHRTMGDRFAIKEYFPQSLVDRENSGTVVIRTHTFETDYYKGLHGFLEEARIVRRLRGHPNVVHVNSFFEANNTAYMVMEYYAGQTLSAFKRQNGDELDEATIRRLFAPVLDALEYIHQREVVHRDLKPDNVFLSEDGRPILLDFGASRFAATGGTVPMTAVLTQGFAPPEQYISADSGETVLRQGPWSDIYALGATLHMLACGRPPYDAMVRQMSGQDPQPPASARLPGYSAAFCRAIDASLRLDMKQRPQSIAEFRAIWNDAPLVLPPPLAVPVSGQAAANTSQSAGASTTPPPPALPQAAASTTPPPALRAQQPQSVPAAQVTAPVLASGGSRWPLWTGLGVLALGAAGAGGWYLLRDRPGPDGPVVAPAVPAAPAQGTVLMVFTDTACALEVNGQAHGQLEPGHPLSLQVQPGEQAVQCSTGTGEDDDTLIDFQTETVQPGQQAVVKLELQGSEFEDGESYDDSEADLDAADAELEAADAELGELASDDDASDGDGEGADESATTLGEALAQQTVIDLAQPDFPDPVSGASGSPLLRQSAAASLDGNDEDWFATHGLSLDYAQGPTSMAPAKSWTANFTIPDYVPQAFDAQPLLKVIASGEQTLSLYGRDFSSATVLLAQDVADGRPLYALDFRAYAQAPQRIEADRDFVNQQIVWAQQVDSILYVSHAHSTYAKSSYGKNAYITALDTTADFAVVWRSPAQVANAQNFVVIGDVLLTGYGFTAEPDYLFVLDRSDGSVRQREALKSGPDWLILKDNTLHVLTYDMQYQFEPL